MGSHHPQLPRGVSSEPTGIRPAIARVLVGALIAGAVWSAVASRSGDPSVPAAFQSCLHTEAPAGAVRFGGRQLVVREWRDLTVLLTTSTRRSGAATLSGCTFRRERGHYEQTDVGWTTTFPRADDVPAPPSEDRAVAACRRLIARRAVPAARVGGDAPTVAVSFRGRVGVVVLGTVGPMSFDAFCEVVTHPSGRPVVDTFDIARVADSGVDVHLEPSAPSPPRGQ